MPLRADLERIVLQIAQAEWKQIVRAMRLRDGGLAVSGCCCGCFSASIVNLRV